LTITDGNWPKIKTALEVQNEKLNRRLSCRQLSQMISARLDSPFEVRFISGDDAKLRPIAKDPFKVIQQRSAHIFAHFNSTVNALLSHASDRAFRVSVSIMVSPV
jgi:hypothetical protein